MNTERKTAEDYPQTWRREAREVQAFIDPITMSFNDADLLLSLRAAAVHPDLSEEAQMLAAHRAEVVAGRLEHSARKNGGVQEHHLHGSWSLVVIA